MPDPITEDVLAIARAAFEALEARDWVRLRSYVDPAALAAIKDQAIAVADTLDAHQPSPSEEIQAAQPGMPRVVAEWFAEQERRAGESQDPAGLDALGVSSIEELRSLAPEEVFVRWMTATQMTERLRRATGHAHVAASRYIVLGVVMEGDVIAHALYRVKGYRQGVQVESLGKAADGWRLSEHGVLSQALRTHFRVGPRVAR